MYWVARAVAKARPSRAREVGRGVMPALRSVNRPRDLSVGRVLLKPYLLRPGCMSSRNRFPPDQCPSQDRPPGWSELVLPCGGALIKTGSVRLKGGDQGYRPDQARGTGVNLHGR